MVEYDTDRAVQIVRANLDRLGVEQVEAYQDNCKQPHRIRGRRSVEIRGPKGLRMISLMEDIVGKEPPDVFVTYLGGKRGGDSRGLLPADVVKLDRL